VKLTVGTLVTLFMLSAVVSCAKKVPVVDLSAADPTFVKRCTEEVGAIIGTEERYLDYFDRTYDNTAYRSLSGDRTPVHRRVIKILNAAGAERASKFSVIHYREQLPLVEARAWMANGTERKVAVRKLGTRPLADWPCDYHVARKSDFRIGTLEVGDTVEIIYPIGGPDTLRWDFASDQFCILHSKATFGHASDQNRPDLHATVFDASGGVKRTSVGEAYPMVFELTKPLMPISTQRIPFVLLAPRCPDWTHLRAQLFHLPLWMARSGDVAGRKKVNPLLVKPIENDEKARRIQTTASWMQGHIKLEDDSPIFWMRWMPLKPAGKTAAKRRGSKGDWAALAFRILEDAGLKPRFALLHTHAKNELDESLPTTSQLDTLAVTLTDETGKTHWLVPGLEYDPEQQPPKAIRGRRALVVKRYWLNREQGTGDCIPVDANGFSCQVNSPEPIEFDFIKIPKD
jgi:hypothetical protein